jgi:drug/metabolite transporter (DMT)-like permease
MKQPRPLDFAMLLALSLMWGSSFMFIELALVSFGPFMLAAARIVIAALLLWLFARLTGHHLPLDRRSWQLAAHIAVAGLVLPFPLIGWAQQGIESSQAAIIMAFTPLSTLVMVHMLTGEEKLTPGRVAGLVLGLAGVALLLGGAGIDDLLVAGPRQFAVFLATLGYAYSSILMRQMAHISPVSVSAAIMIAAAVLIVPLALLFEEWPQAPIEPMAGLATLFLGIFPSALAIVVMIHLINRIGVTFMSMNNYLVPAIGVIWGAILLNEEITGQTGGAFVLILCGVALASFTARRGRSKES